MDQITIAQNANVNRKIITLAEILLHQLSPSAIWLVLKKFGQYGLPRVRRREHFWSNTSIHQILDKILYNNVKFKSPVERF